MNKIFIKTKYFFIFLVVFLFLFSSCNTGFELSSERENLDKSTLYLSIFSNQNQNLNTNNDDAVVIDNATSARVLSSLTYEGYDSTISFYYTITSLDTGNVIGPLPLTQDVSGTTIGNTGLPSRGIGLHVGKYNITVRGEKQGQTNNDGSTIYYVYEGSKNITILKAGQRYFTTIFLEPKRGFKPKDSTEITYYEAETGRLFLEIFSVEEILKGKIDYNFDETYLTATLQSISNPNLPLITLPVKQQMQSDTPSYIVTNVEENFVDVINNITIPFGYYKLSVKAKLLNGEYQELIAGYRDDIIYFYKNSNSDDVSVHNIILK